MKESLKHCPDRGLKRSWMCHTDPSAPFDRNKQKHAIQLHLKDNLNNGYLERQLRSLVTFPNDEIPTQVKTTIYNDALDMLEAVYADVESG